LLAQYSSEVIPKMYLVNAGLLLFCSSFLIAAIDRTNRGTLFFRVLIAHACILVICRGIIALGVTSVYIGLFSYAYVSKIVFFSIFWTLVNDVIDTRSASKEFPLIAAGGTIGAIGISFALPWILDHLDATNVLVLWAGISLIVAWRFKPVQKKFARNFHSTKKVSNASTVGFVDMIKDIRLVKNEALLRNMSIFYFVLFFMLLNQHYHFYTVVREKFTDANEMASFFGFFNGISMGVTVLLQISVSGLILKKLGASRSMFLMPLILMFAFAALAWSGFAAVGTGVLFWMVIIGMSARVGFFDSFFSPNFQLFFSSLPSSIRGRGKFTIEGVVKPLAMVCTSLWLLLVTPHLSLFVNGLILLCVALYLVVQTFTIKRTYTDSLITYLRSVKSLQNAENLQALSEAQARSLIEKLTVVYNEEEQVVKLFVMSMLLQLPARYSKPSVQKMLQNCHDAHLLSEIISLIGRYAALQYKHEIISLLTHSDERTVANCIIALRSSSGQKEVAEVLYPFLKATHNRILANTLIVLWDTLPRSEREPLLLLFLYHTNDDYSASGLYVLAQVSFDMDFVEYYTERYRRLRSHRPSLTQFCGALSRRASKKHCSLLLKMSTHLPKAHHSIISDAISTMLRQGLEVKVVLLIAEKATAIEQFVAFEGLFSAFDKLHSPESEQLEKIFLQQLRNVHTDLQAYRALGLLTPLEPEQQDSVKLFRCALAEELIQIRIKSICKMAALLDPGGSVRLVVHRLHHSNPHIRARATEVLDNADNNRINKPLIALLEMHADITSRAVLSVGGAMSREKLETILQTYTQSSDRWVRSCAEFSSHTLRACSDVV